MSGDVAIIGSSLAGLYAGHLLSSAGRRVRVYESQSDLRPLKRSLIVTAAYRELLGELGDPAVVNEIDRYELYADGKMAEVRLGRPDLIIERADLVQSLRERAEASGAELCCGHRFRRLEETAGVHRLRFGGRTDPEHAGVVIGADGARSRVARCAGLRLPPVAPLVQALVRLPPDMTHRSTRVWFVPEDTPYFYWLIPDSESTGALGVIGRSRQDTRILLDRFVRRQGLRLIEYQAARIPAYAGWNRNHARLPGGDVYLVGDAAGHVKVTTVGGVVNGLWGARGVVDRILGQGRTRLRSLRLELGLHLLVRRALHNFCEDDYRQLLDLLDAGSLRTLARYTRDEVPRLLLSLVLQRPRFALLGIRGLCMSLTRGGRPRIGTA